MKYARRIKLFPLFLMLWLLPSTVLFSQNVVEDFNTWTEKGRDFIGLNFSVSHEQGNNVQRLLITDNQMYTLDWAVRFYGGHFIKNNMTVGALFEWDQSNGNREFVADGTNIREDYFERGFLVGPTFRTYLPLGKTNRVSIFNEVNALVGFSRSVEQRDNGSEISRGIAETYRISIGLTPGINFFIADGWAFEVAVELLGLETRVTRGNVDGVESEKFSNDVNFSINLLALKLGVTKYF
jgi:hypothetical protein